MVSTYAAALKRTQTIGPYAISGYSHNGVVAFEVAKHLEAMGDEAKFVQDMVCDTFIKIAQKCRRYFVMQQSEEQEPFVDEIITVDLSPQQAIGYIISAQPNKPQQEKLIPKLMELPNNAWDSLMAQAAQNMDVLSNLDNIKILSNVLKMNMSACLSISSFYLLR
ncbi:hypothetical protein EDB19DRAFT_1916324 [Suillus lakei]|nr:hypothetical protein EDB19DRAFT_1916324 [Suillus lakei]